MTTVTDGQWLFLVIMLIWDTVAVTLFGIYMFGEWRERAALRRMLRGED